MSGGRYPSWTKEEIINAYKKLPKIKKSDIYNDVYNGVGVFPTYSSIKKFWKNLNEFEKETKKRFIETRIKRVIRKCKCGCGQSFRCKINSPKRYIGFHRKRKDLEYRECKCGCGDGFYVKPYLSKKYIFGHYARVQVQKGLSKEEYYGKEKAQKIILSSSLKQKGKTWEELYGKEKAQKRRENLIRKMFPNGGRVGFCEEEVLKHIELKKRINLIRQFFVGGYFVDGYDKENNTVYEVDEWHHQRRKNKKYDLKREQKIKTVLDCKFIRLKVFTDKGLIL